MPKPANKPKRGPKPERLKLRGSWEENAAKLLAKKKPAGGWPKPMKPRP